MSKDGVCVLQRAKAWLENGANVPDRTKTTVGRACNNTAHYRNDGSKELIIDALYVLESRHKIQVTYMQTVDDLLQAIASVQQPEAVAA